MEIFRLQGRRVLSYFVLDWTKIMTCNPARRSESCFRFNPEKGQREEKDNVGIVRWQGERHTVKFVGEYKSTCDFQGTTLKLNSSHCTPKWGDLWRVLSWGLWNANKYSMALTNIYNWQQRLQNRSNCQNPSLVGHFACNVWGYQAY